ncbi:hypothetical protein Tco_1110459 [Tanacetum coccineum]|uniref:Uncharacterized protein n=1 Tax=Tanacetum coccineum TaxID=301880 RepID=A0ABQ5IJA8_9ASTR
MSLTSKSEQYHCATINFSPSQAQATSQQPTDDLLKQRSPKGEEVGRVSKRARNLVLTDSEDEEPEFSTRKVKQTLMTLFQNRLGYTHSYNKRHMLQEEQEEDN